MPTKQTRRSISVRGTTYDALRTYCETHDKSMSEIVEELLARILEDAPAPTVKAERARTVTAPGRPKPLANKVVRAPAPVAGPAPAPAKEVIPERPRAPKGDYRGIQF